MTREQVRKIKLEGLDKVASSWLLWARLTGDQQAVVKAERVEGAQDNSVTDAYLDRLAERTMQYQAAQPVDYERALESVAARTGLLKEQVRLVADAVFGTL